MALLTGTRTAGGSLTVSAAALAAILVAAACGGSGPSSSVHSPTPVAASSPTQSSGSPAASATPSAGTSSTPAAVSGSYGVLAGPFTGTNYGVALVDTAGKVVASAQASTPVSPTCANTAAGVVPYPVSTSNSRAYFMDASGAVRWIAPNGSHSSGAVMSLSVGPSTRSVFAVSPDDTEIAVAVLDFTQGGATTRLFVDELKAGGAQNQIFSETGAYTVWPVGWHAGDLVVAKVVSCTQGGGPTCCGRQEYHVVDPVTAGRKYTVGGPGPGCVVVGAPTPAGTMCENSAFTKATELDWTGTAHESYAINGPVLAFVSPAGDRVAIADNVNGTSIGGTNFKWSHLYACGWIDDVHVLSGGGSQAQPAVGEFPDGVVFPVAAQGDCAGRIPGAL